MINIKALIEKSKSDLEISKEITQENKIFLKGVEVQKTNLNKSTMEVQKEKEKTKQSEMQIGN